MNVFAVDDDLPALVDPVQLYQWHNDRQSAPPGALFKSTLPTGCWLATERETAKIGLMLPRRTSSTVPGLAARARRGGFPRSCRLLLLALPLFLLPWLLAGQTAPCRFAWLSDTHIGSATAEE